MGPIVLLDKSTLQSLSHDEVIILHKYYLVNIAPVLTIEILGDLKKPTKDSLSQDKVVELANKLLPYDFALNVHFRNSIAASLLGYDVKMDGRPLLGGGRSVITREGGKGIVFEETPEAKALFRWRDGDFLEAEKELAERWRESTRGVDFESLRQHLRDVYNAVPRFRSLEELQIYLNKFLVATAFQVNFLKLLIFEFNLDFNNAQKIFYRWEIGNFKTIKDFSPYAFYCFSVNMFFQFGLMSDLIGTKATNRVDLEYLYYLPFCMIFGSNDKFHKLLTPFFLRKEQSFISGQDLKADLSSIANRWNVLDEKGKLEWTHEFGYAPPTSLSSILWDKHMNPEQEHKDFASNLSKDQSKRIIDMIKNKLNGQSENPNINTDCDSADFVIRKTYIRLNDLCPCGSGKQFKDCHGVNLA